MCARAAAEGHRSVASVIRTVMRKYKALVRGENFLINLDGEDQKLGFFTTAFVEAQDEDQAEQMAIGVLRDDQDFRKSILNVESDSPMMFVDEIEQVQSFEGQTLPRTGFSFFRKEGKEAEEI
jgi:hypothetical protein